MKDLAGIVKLELAVDMRLGRLKQELEDKKFIFEQKHREVIDARDDIFAIKEEIKRLLKWKGTSVL